MDSEEDYDAAAESGIPEPPPSFAHAIEIEKYAPGQSGLKELRDELESFEAKEEDIYTEQDCVTLTNSVNAQIQHVAVSIVNAFRGLITPSTSLSSNFGSNSSPTHQSESQSDSLMSDGTPPEFRSIRTMLGEPAYQFFLNPQNRHRVDSVRYLYLTRCAIQAILATLSEEIISVWSFNREEHNILLGIYISLRDQHDNPALTSTWRSLTRTHTKISQYYPLKPSAVLSFSSEISKVLLLSGLAAQWNIEDTKEMVKDYFERDLGELYDCCFRLDRVAHHGVAARDTGGSGSGNSEDEGEPEEMRAFDVVVYRPEPGEVYDKDMMDPIKSSSESSGMGMDANGEGEEEKDFTEYISSTCGLGLLKIDTTAGSLKGTEEILLKPSVQLSSLFLSNIRNNVEDG
ncbi:hypothetical protein GYMLUDRAFT_88219 [Collybiopsis luxurians FD-317 M1]|uniref:Unplaced genomic scaffold GYMLUscaffold_72, whole genome shotgun sequence n=1 Tax=Collybiopsis luxurians FD-317 M1 TaxID=944289 RepID=A0A0D0BWI5_9AGAR|nr:hypothetical protein GYMLUDRAFT_88219 [Collybiopsis luxurians FD-317 M1]